MKKAEKRAILDQEFQVEPGLFTAQELQDFIDKGRGIKDPTDEKTLKRRQQLEDGKAFLRENLPLAVVTGGLSLLAAGLSLREIKNKAKH